MQPGNIEVGLELTNFITASAVFDPVAPAWHKFAEGFFINSLWHMIVSWESRKLQFEYLSHLRSVNFENPNFVIHVFITTGAAGNINFNIASQVHPSNSDIFLDRNT